MDLSRSIELSLDCHRSCEQTVVHCLAQGGAHATRDHIRLLMDCSEICALNGDFLSRGSDFHRQSCQACAIICEECAEDCRKFDDPIMRSCAELCRSCAESCRELIVH